MPRRACRRAATATSRQSRLASSRSASVSVPGVTMRSTLRSTGPLLVAGSPICSQIATDSPSFISSREVAARPRGSGTPAIGIGAPADCPRAVSVMSSSARRALGVVVEQLVEIAHPVEQELVRMLRLDAQILLHHRRVRGERGFTGHAGVHRLGL